MSGQDGTDRFKRINILIRQDQYDRLAADQISVSGFVRDLLDDRFNQNSITLSVTQPVRKFYDLVVSNFGSGDPELGIYLLRALDEFLSDRSKLIDSLRSTIKSEIEER